MDGHQKKVIAGVIYLYLIDAFIVVAVVICLVMLDRSSEDIHWAMRLIASLILIVVGIVGVFYVTFFGQFILFAH